MGRYRRRGKRPSGGYRKPGRACSVCGRSVPSGEPHSHQKQPSSSERKRMRAAVRNWRALYGDLCPGYQRPPHPAEDLQADHVVPRSRGGLGGSLQVLCGLCNRQKSDK